MTETLLKGRSKNSIRSYFSKPCGTWLDFEEISIEEISKIDARKLMEIPNCGKKTVDNISAYLVENGYPALSIYTKPIAIKRLEAFAHVLTKNGWKVLPP